MTIEDLTAYGFREYKDSLCRSDRNFQFCVRGEKGRKAFFVNVRFWRHSKYDSGVDGWDATTQFESEGKTFNVELFVRPTDAPGEVVDWYKRLWGRMGCDPYEKED